jgi:hypothetical protein
VIVLVGYGSGVGVGGWAVQPVIANPMTVVRSNTFLTMITNCLENLDCLLILKLLSSFLYELPVNGRTTF